MSWRKIKKILRRKQAGSFAKGAWLNRSGNDLSLGNKFFEQSGFDLAATPPNIFSTPDLHLWRAGVFWTNQFMKPVRTVVFLLPACWSWLFLMFMQAGPLDYSLLRNPLWHGEEVSFATGIPHHLGMAADLALSKSRLLTPVFSRSAFPNWPGGQFSCTSKCFDRWVSCRSATTATVPPKLKTSIRFYEPIHFAAFNLPEGNPTKLNSCHLAGVAFKLFPSFHLAGVRRSAGPLARSPFANCRQS